jgi:threonine synthase
MWRFRSLLPLLPDESPVTLGEGGTPLLSLERSGSRLGASQLLIKDESANPTGSFKARGLSAAITRAAAAGATGFVLPTAGNAGVAASAYGARAGLPVQVFAPAWTPSRLIQQMRRFGASVTLLEGHIGVCGRAAREWAGERGWVDLSTLREPYRIEGKKTLGLEIAMQLGWRLPSAVIYPAGGGTGLIGMWRAFTQLRQLGWVEDEMPRLFAVQSEGCAPVVRAWEEGAESVTAWDNPETSAFGLRVPGPLGGRLMLRALRDSRGGAVAVSDADMSAMAERISRDEGIDLSPEGGATLVAAGRLISEGTLVAGDRIVTFNTGAGWLYRTA